MWKQKLRKLRVRPPFLVLNAVGFLSIVAAAIVAYTQRWRQQRAMVVISPGPEALLESAA